MSFDCWEVQGFDVTGPSKVASISAPDAQTSISNHCFPDCILNKVMILPELALSNPDRRMKSIHLLLLCSLGWEQHSIPMWRNSSNARGAEGAPCRQRKAPPSGAKRRPPRPVPAARPKFGPRRHLQSRIAHHLVGCSPTLENWMLTGFVGLQVFVMLNNCCRFWDGPGFGMLG